MGAYLPKRRSHSKRPFTLYISVSLDLYSPSVSGRRSMLPSHTSNAEKLNFAQLSNWCKTRGIYVYNPSLDLSNIYQSVRILSINGKATTLYSKSKKRQTTNAGQNCPIMYLMSPEGSERLSEKQVNPQRIHLVRLLDVTAVCVPTCLRVLWLLRRLPPGHT